MSIQFQLLVEADSYPIRRIGSSQIPFPSHLNGYYCEEKKESYGPQLSEAYSEASHINNSIPRKEKDPGRLGELAHTKLTIELADKTVKYPKGIAENVLVELRRDQVDDLMPTIEEGEVIGEFRAKTLLKAKKSMKLVKYQSSGALCVIVVTLAIRRIYNTHSCSKTQHGESTEQNIRGVSHSNSF
ncbi:hypothetical protein Tco_0546721 [Tanacetum coccineum]